MKINFNQKYTTIAVYAVITFAVCFGIVIIIDGLPEIAAFCKTIASLLAPITWGVVFAYLMNPVLKFSERILKPVICRKKEHKKILRFISVFISTVVFLGIVAAVVAIILPQIIKSFQSIAANFYTYFANIQTWVLDILEDYPDVKDNVINILNDLSANWYSYLISFTGQLTNLDFENIRDMAIKVGGGAVNVLSTLLDALIGIIIMIYLLYSKEVFLGQMKKIIVAILPNRACNKLLDTGAKLNMTLSGFINGKIIDSVIIGIICFIGMTIMKMEYSVLISVIVGITNIIPFFGPFIGAIPSGLLLLIAAPEQVIPFVIFILVLQQFDGNVLGPYILGDSTGLSAIWVMVAIFIGGHFGFGGMILGVPLFAVLYTIIKDFVESLLEKKNLPVETSNYMPVPAVSTIKRKRNIFNKTKDSEKKAENNTGEENE
jgi:predicted PurR-regulated permease PerM